MRKNLMGTFLLLDPIPHREDVLVFPLRFASLVNKSQQLR